MSPYDIIRKLIEKIIIPAYPELKLNDVDSFAVSYRRNYGVRFITKTKLPTETQVKIDTELKNLFKAASLDETEIGRYRPNTISVWFKTPREKEFSFRAPTNYEH
jgi:hypothetical protein